MPIDVDEILARLTLEQKVALMSGADSWHTAAVPGVPVLRCSDGPAGVRGTSWSGPASASFPCGTALGATFDPELVEEVGRALGRECRSKGAQMLLAPTVNLHRTPIGGRNFECMSEDPTLTAHLAVAYVRGVQHERVAACIKHFVANDTEFERMTISSEVDERTMRELYLVPFEAAVRPVDEGGADARSMMSSYNRVNGRYVADDLGLMRSLLRDEWGWDGVVVSDWFARHDTVASALAGLDLEMPGPTRERGEQLVRAVRDGEVDPAHVDECVRRLLRLFDWCGLDADAAPLPEATDDSADTRDVIRRAAIRASVLLTNRTGDDGVATLPLAPGRRIALIGPNAARGRIQGGGSAQVRANRPSALLEVLRERGVDVTHVEGCRIDKRLPALRGEFDVSYVDVHGNEARQHVERLTLVWMDEPAPGIDRHHFGAVVSGSFVPETAGTWTIGVVAAGPAVVRVDGEVVVDLSTPQTGGALFGNASPEIRARVELDAGVPVQVEVDLGLWPSPMMRGLMIGVEGPEPDDGVELAVAAARDADVAVVVVGTNADWETEGEDRTTMDLPGRQDELVRRVAEVNPSTIVVINAGSPVSMPWLEDVGAVMQVWFPGEEMGNAIADVLFGVAEPGGRLPMTIPARLEDTPAYLSHPGEGGLARYDEHQFIGYRWYDAREIEPRFPFGHGLGYTTWAIGGASIQRHRGRRDHGDGADHQHRLAPGIDGGAVLRRGTQRRSAPAAPRTARLRPRRRRAGRHGDRHHLVARASVRDLGRGEPRLGGRRAAPTTCSSAPRPRPRPAGSVVC
ncbi:MAG: glycoside hydrolase family 3 C-terminal domain-containing protein [Ilumatobacteraceae bacterium]